jgi:hypothetical protein
MVKISKDAQKIKVHVNRIIGRTEEKEKPLDHIYGGVKKRWH